MHVSPLPLPVVCNENQQIDVDLFEMKIETRRAPREYFAATITGLLSHLPTPNLTLTREKVLTFGHEAVVVLSRLVLEKNFHQYF